MSRVFIGIVTNTERKGYCREALIKNIMEQTAHKNHEIAIFLIDNAKNSHKNLYPEWMNYRHEPIPEGDHSIRQVLAEQRNMLRLQFLKMDYDCFFSWESDVILPKNTIQDLIQVIQEVKKISNDGINWYDANIGAVTAVNVHHSGEDTNLPIAITNHDTPRKELHRNVTWDDVLHAHKYTHGIMPISGSGVGCSMIKKEALQKIRFRVELDKGAYDDMFFSKDLTSEGYEQVMDCRIIADHRQGGWEGVRK